MSAADWYVTITLITCAVEAQLVFFHARFTA